MLDDLKDLEPKALVKGVLTLKVVKCELDHLETTYGPRSLKRMYVKDQAGTKSQTTLWENHKKFHVVKEGKVYKFANLMMDKYPKKKPHFMSTKVNI